MHAGIYIEIVDLELARHPAGDERELHELPSGKVPGMNVDRI
jgi:hypothetical protein